MSELHQRAIVLLAERFTLDQISTLLQYCRTRGYEMVGATRALIGAVQMVEAGKADVIIVDSRSHLMTNGRLEVVSQEISRLDSPTARHRSDRPRRLQ